MLVLTNPKDITTDFVVLELNRRNVPVFRCDPEQFPLELSLEVNFAETMRGVLRLADRSVRLEEIGCVYYRRPGDFRITSSLSEGEQVWARREAKHGFYGAIRSLPHWLNHPSAIENASYKPVQLRAAIESGLRIAATLVTNDCAAAADFASKNSQSVYKTLGSPVFGDNYVQNYILTSLIDAAGLDESVSLTAHQFQAWVPKQFEVRLTVIDDDFHAARIDARTDKGAVDWRADPNDLVYSVIDTPLQVRAAVKRLMRKLDLRFGAIDFIVDHGDNWVFLEVNPNGQWAWIQLATGAPIAVSIADALTRSQAQGDSRLSGTSDSIGL
ncbi:ATP-grasp ribosomal peptide maturase [Catellatospora sp. NPDC049609]|uniref:ATP-grasp ribosomal peptide maturase n=1 Tax=Catellatospora sp. NPDC049609 TaxID=3155505 RepID=UPI0034224A65